MMMVMMVFSSLSSSSGTYQRYYYCANNTNKNVMLFDTKKGTRRKRKKMRAKSTPKRTKEAHERDEDLGEIVQNRCAKISHKCCCCRGATRHFQKRIYSYFCTFCALFCELSADFHAKESLTFSRKIRPVVVVVELFVLFARDRGTKDEKRASSSRSRALFKKWNYS